MEDYEAVSEKLPKEQFVLFVTSTFGSGESPDNGKRFWKELHCMKQQTVVSDMDLNENLERGPLSEMIYAVFALGSSQYSTFCSFGKNIDRILSELGAQRLFPVALADEMRGQDQPFLSWSRDVLKASCIQFGIPMNLKIKSITCNATGRSDGEGECSDKSTSFKFSSQNVRFVPASAEEVPAEERDLLVQLGRMHNKKNKVFPLRMISKQYLQPTDSDRQTLLVRLMAPKPPNRSQYLNDYCLTPEWFKYEPGDHLGVFAENPPEAVDQLMRHIELNSSKDLDLYRTLYRVEFLNEMIQKWIPSEKWSTSVGPEVLQKYKLPVCTIQHALKRYLDIMSCPTQEFLMATSKKAMDERDVYQLERLALNDEEFATWRRRMCPTVIDLIDLFPSLRLDAAFLITHLPLLSARLYSISSSQKTTPNEVHLTMSLVRFSAQDGKG